MRAQIARSQWETHAKNPQPLLHSLGWLASCSNWSLGHSWLILSGKAKSVSSLSRNTSARRRQSLRISARRRAVSQGSRSNDEKPFWHSCFRVMVAKSGFMGIGHIGITYSQHRSQISSFVCDTYSYMTSTAAARTLHALQCLGAQALKGEFRQHCSAYRMHCS